MKGESSFSYQESTFGKLKFNLIFGICYLDMLASCKPIGDFFFF